MDLPASALTCSTRYRRGSTARREPERLRALAGICRVALLLAAVFSLATFAGPVRAETVRLIEITYELDLSSLDGRPLPTTADATADPEGFLLVGDPAGGPTVLYPAMRAPPPESPETGLWAALRFRDRLAGEAVDMRMLEPVDSLPYSPVLEPSLAIAPVFDIAVEGIEEGDILIEVDGEAHRLAPGAPTVVAVGERTVSQDDFADAVLEAYRAAGVPEADLPSREAVADEVASFSSVGDGVTFHARVVAVNHGPVALADIDLATVWREARRMAREGPYEEALVALETLLDVMPGHAGAARLFHATLDLVEAGATPAHAVGTVGFPDGQPDDATRALWAAAHGGFAMFTRPDDPPGSALMAIPVRDGAFAAYLPAGPYRLTVNVPGFARSEQEITLDGETEIDVPLAASD